MTTIAPESRAGIERDREHRSRAARIAGWSGVVFGVLFIAGFVLVAQVPAYDEPDAAWVNTVEDSGERGRTVAGTLLLSAAALLLMTFLTALASYIRGAVGEAPEHVVGILRGAGVIAGVTLLLAAIAGGSMHAAVTFAPDFPAPSGEIIRVLDQLAIGFLLIGTAWSLAVYVACASRLAARTGALPGWLTTGGLVVAAALLVSVQFLPILLVPVWALVTGVVLLQRARAMNAPEPG